MPVNLQQASWDTEKYEQMEGMLNHTMHTMQGPNGRQKACDNMPTSNGTETMGKVTDIL